MEESSVQLVKSSLELEDIRGRCVEAQQLAKQRGDLVSDLQGEFMSKVAVWKLNSWPSRKATFSVTFKVNSCQWSLCGSFTVGQTETKPCQQVKFNSYIAVRKLY